MPLKYDLILEENGVIIIKRITALNQEDARARAKGESSVLRGIVFVEEGEESSLQLHRA